MSVTSRLLPRFYPVLSRLLGPVLRLLLRLRVITGKENRHRLYERRGLPSIPRPKGKLAWLHAASVGEALTAITLIRELRAHGHDSLHFLLTTGTLTSADLAARRMDIRDMHQFIPLDHPRWVARFLDHWQPDAAFWMESELWPNMLAEIKARSIPAAIVNGRLSARSEQKWQAYPDWISDILSGFNAVLAQSPEDTDRFRRLGALNPVFSGNLKYGSQLLEASEIKLQAWKNAIADRPVLLYASTHDGEEDMALQIHEDLIDDHPNLLSIIIPRHPQRGDDIWQSIKTRGVSALRHSIRPDQLPDEKTKVFLADTLGELGLFYRLVPFAFIGNSLVRTPGGGHNPFEALQCGAIPICGPYMENFAHMTRDMIDFNVLKPVNDEDHLAACFSAWLDTPDAVSDLHVSAKGFMAKTEPVIEDTLHHLKPVLKALS